MAGETDLEKLLAAVSPIVMPGEYVFCCVEAGLYGEILEWQPLATFREEEGLTLLLKKVVADERALHYHGVFSGISLGVHSSLEAVGLTAAVATALANKGIPANVIAAYHHDHIFIPADRTDDALGAIRNLAN